jgi:hypothetical protein
MGLSLIQKIRLLATLNTLYNKLSALYAQNGGKMSPVKLTQVGSLIAQALASFGAAHFISTNMANTGWLMWVLAGLNVILTVGHALLPSALPAPDALPSAQSVATKAGMIVLMILAGSMLWPVSAQAQAATTSTTASASNGFAATSEAVAIRYSGEWSVGTHVTESYDFADFGKTKANHLYVQGHELLAPTPGLSIYAGGLQFEPDLTALLKRTNLPASNFGVYFNGAAGNGVPSSGGSHISFLAGGGVKYALTSALTWQSLNVQYFRYGSNNGAAISTGLSFIFGK